MDQDVIRRAREVLTDATMAELLDEEPTGPNAFRDAVRQQIFMLCTRLRVTLVIVNQLMTVANNLATKANK
jgi:hypothetical protein